MAKRRRRKRKPLSGISAAFKDKWGERVKQTAFVLGGGLAGAGLGAAMGRYSVIGGLPMIVAGICLDNKALLSGGVAMTFSNVSRGGYATNGLGDIKTITEGAKDRVKLYFDNFKDKLFLPVSKPKEETPPVEGLGDNNAYFVNPFKRGVGEIDLSQLDKIQAQVAEMGVLPGLEDIDREL